MIQIEAKITKLEGKGLASGHGMEWKFWYGIWMMPEWNGRFQK